MPQSPFPELHLELLLAISLILLAILYVIPALILFKKGWALRGMIAMLVMMALTLNFLASVVSPDTTGQGLALSISLPSVLWVLLLSLTFMAPMAPPKLVAVEVEPEKDEEEGDEEESEEE